MLPPSPGPGQGRWLTSAPLLPRLSLGSPVIRKVEETEGPLNPKYLPRDLSAAVSKSLHLEGHSLMSVTNRHRSMSSLKAGRPKRAGKPPGQFASPTWRNLEKTLLLLPLPSLCSQSLCKEARGSEQHFSDHNGSAERERGVDWKGNGNGY